MLSRVSHFVILFYSFLGYIWHRRSRNEVYNFGQIPKLRNKWRLDLRFQTCKLQPLRYGFSSASTKQRNFPACRAFGSSHISRFPVGFSVVSLESKEATTIEPWETIDVQNSPLRLLEACQIGRSEKPKSWKSKNRQADYLPRHSPNVRTVFEI